MSTFSADPAAFSIHARYVTLLKAGVKKVTKVPTTKFIYFKTYKFAASKKGPLVVVDFDAKLVAAMAKKGLKPHADGVVSLTAEGKELDFDVKHGKLERKLLKRYLANLSKSIKPVFVTDKDEDDPTFVLDTEGDGEDESEEESESESRESDSGKRPIERKPSVQISDAMILRLKQVSGMTLAPPWEEQKEGLIDDAFKHLKLGEVAEAKRIFDTLAGHEIGSTSPKRSNATTTPIGPVPQKPGPSGPSTTTPTSTQPVRVDAPQAKPLPDTRLLKMIGALRDTPLQPAWEAQKHDILVRALGLIKAGDVKGAEALLSALSNKRIGAKPLPTTPDKANDSGEGGEEDDEESSGEAVLDAPQVIKAALPAATSVLLAQKRLQQEEDLFRLRKMEVKSDKIKVSYSQQKEAELAEQEEQERKAKKAKRKEEGGDKGLLGGLRDRFTRGKESRESKAIVGSSPQGDPSFEDDRGFQDDGDEDDISLDIDYEKEVIDLIPDPDSESERDPERKGKVIRQIAQDKVDAEIRKFGKAGTLAKYGGMAEKGVATAAGVFLDPAVETDNIVGSGGAIAISTAGVFTGITDAGRAFYAYSKTKGAQRSVHLDEAMDALTAAFGNLVNLSKATVNVVDQSHAAETGSAVPILGIVVAVPSLMGQINTLRSAITRLAKQEKVHLQIQKQIEKGDTTQITLDTMLTSFIYRDSGSVAKAIVRIGADCTKIAGHGVTAGGITGPIGMAMVIAGSGTKLVVSGASKVEDFVRANRANDRRKKLQPTANAQSEWDNVRKSDSNIAENADLDDALRALAAAHRDTQEHADALERLRAAAKAMVEADNVPPKVLKYALKLLEQVKQEFDSWYVAVENDADDDENGDGPQGKPQRSNAADAALQRQARKLIKSDLQVAAQMLIDQALREGQSGGPALKVLKSFGITEKQLFNGDEGDDAIANIRDIRGKVMHKLASQDDAAKTLSQTLGGAKDSAKEYLSMPSKHRELEAYALAKEKLEVGGRKKRGPLWTLKMAALPGDVEEKKKALLEQVEILLRRQDIDEGVAREVRELLRPRKEKPGKG